MLPIKLSKREKNLALIVLGFIIFFIFHQFLFVPKWNEIDRLKIQAQGLRLNLDVAEKKVKILEAVDEDFSKTHEREKGTVKAEEKVPEVLSSFSETISKSKLELLSVKPMAIAGEDLKFELSCSGTYQQLCDFLDLLHGLKILVMIDSVTINSRGGVNPKLDIRMILTAHF